MKSSAYESMRYISSQENALNPSYDPGSIEDYNQYKARRDSYAQEEEQKR
jgi:hypothetical protein